MKKIALIDGYGFVFRAYHSLPPLLRADGTPVGAVFGFTNMLIKLIASLEVSHLAVIFDSGSKTFRNQIYPEYKSNRPPCPEDLIPQFPIVRECAEALNIPVLEKIGFEADDIIATIAKKSAQQDFQVIIVSSDKDLMQLVDNNISMFDAMKNKAISFDEVFEKFMVKPDKVLEVLALMGDSSDNVPGVKGIGPKTASELINQFGSIENLYQNLDQIKQEKRRTILEANRDNAFLSKKLIQLDENVSLGVEIDDLKTQNLNPHKLISFLDNQGFKSLVYRVKKEFNIENENIKNEKIADEKLANNLNETNSLLKDKFHLSLQNHDCKPEFELLEIENHDAIKKIYLESKLKGTIVVDYLIENDDFAYITLCPQTDTTTEDKTKCKIYYKNFKKHNSTNSQQIDLLNFNDNSNINDRNHINIASFNQILFDNSIKKVFFNGKIFLRFYKNFIRKNNLAQNNNSIVFDDVNLISYLTNSAVHNSLRELIDINLNINFEERGFGEILDKIYQNNSCNLFSNELEKINFLGQINIAILLLYHVFAPKIIELKMYNSYLKNELPLLEVLASIEYNGIKVDSHKLLNLANEFNQEISRLSAQIFEICGTQFNISSSKQLGEILFDKLGLNSTKKSKKTKAPSTNAKVLEDLAFEGHEIANKIINFRKFTKLNNTYCETLPKQVNNFTNRIHTTLSSTATLTGRLTSINPNLQNIPIKSAEGKKIRECFVASKNHLLISADYSQIELRILAHMAEIKDLVEAFNLDKDIHKITASQIFGVSENLVDQTMRNKAKTINFGIIYGISPYGLSRQLKISNKEASQYIKSYFEKYSGIKEYMKSKIDFARQNGFVETISKRKCFINEINNKNPIIRQEAERQAINAPIQGSSADIIKKAMINFHRHLIEKDLKSKLVLQIHDELLVEAPENEVDEIVETLRTSMTQNYKLAVDLKVDFSINNFWS